MENKSPSNPNKGAGAKSPCNSATKPCKRPSRAQIECPTKVEFKEDNTKYGFDDHTSATVSWKSLEAGKSDTIMAKITPAAKYNNVKFTSTDTSKVIISPAKAGSGAQVVQAQGIANGESEIKASCDGSILGKIKVKTYIKRTKTIAVRLVHEKNYNSTDVADAVIKSYLKKVYDQAVFEFKVTRLPAKTVVFDLNGDGKLDDDNWMTVEMQRIRDACKDTKYDYNIFLVDNPSFGGAGFMDFNQRYGFVYVDVGVAEKTIAHELGHGAFGLMHTPSDSDNIMYSSYSDAKWRLRKAQWDEINP